MSDDPGLPAVEDALDQRSLQRTGEYFQALGRFVHEFSFVEAGLQSLVAQLGEMHDAIAKAVLSDSRIERSMSLVRRLNEAKGLAPDPILDDVFEQLRAINERRNHIVHFGARIQADPDRDMVVTNRRSAHIPKKITSFPVTPDLLHNMAEDLIAICECLDIAVLRLLLSPESVRETGLEHVERAPWRYTRP